MKQKGQIGTPVESLIYGSRRLDITSGLLGFCCGVILVTAAVLTLVFIKAGRIEQTLKTDFAILLIVPLFSATVISACVELFLKTKNKKSDIEFRVLYLTATWFFVMLSSSLVIILKNIYGI